MKKYFGLIAFTFLIGNITLSFAAEQLAPTLDQRVNDLENKVKKIETKNEEKFTCWAECFCNGVNNGDSRNGTASVTSSSRDEGYTKVAKGCKTLCEGKYNKFNLIVAVPIGEVVGDLQKRSQATPLNACVKD